MSCRCEQKCIVIAVTAFAAANAIDNFDIIVNLLFTLYSSSKIAFASAFLQSSPFQCRLAYVATLAMAAMIAFRVNFDI